jgi:uncharacterized protein YutE (UPF0331/DUF86 family)
MELLGHSFSHFNASKELDRKLVILHLANAVELILKDLVLDSGESIYKGSKETITIHGCFKTLGEKNIRIPYLNKLELLIDERNALQHRFGSPNELTTIFYMNIAQDFFREILAKHYNQQYDEILTQFADEKELVAFRMREPTDDTELENLKKLANVHSLGALLSAMTYLENLTLDFAETIGIEEDLRRRSSWHVISPRFLERFGIEFPSNLVEKLDETRRLRNLVAHGRKEPSKNDVASAIEAVEEYEKFLQSIDIESARKKVKAHLEDLEREKERRRAEFEGGQRKYLPDHPGVT